MTGNELRAVAEFEQSLRAGMQVAVRWTNSHRYYRAKAEVLRVNGKSVRVRLSEAIDGYPAGTEIVAPLILNYRGWSCNNRVEPEAGYPQV